MWISYQSIWGLTLPELILPLKGFPEILGEEEARHPQTYFDINQRIMVSPITLSLTLSVKS